MAEENKDAAPATPTKKEEGPSMKEVFEKAKKRALGGGIAGATAMVCQVTALMWLRTTMNYQYRNGTSTIAALKHLYKEGGVRRFYRGYGPALLQGPLSRFGDTAANTGVLTFMNSMEETREMPTFFKSACASLAASSWRIFLMPIDTTKTILQVEGAKGLNVLGNKIKKGGPLVLYHGGLGAAGATYVGHLPWFGTFNYLNATLPKGDTPFMELARNAACGFTASVVSDTCSNSVRVLKTTKQTFATSITYREAAKHVIEKDGVLGLFGRGLRTRILANGIQGMMFSVLWKYFERKLNERH